VKFIKEKRELLIIKLFINKVKASDILFNILTIITRYINFLFIIIKDIHKVIIKVNNMAFNVNEVLIIILQVT
jgi:hypothetical protein